MQNSVISSHLETVVMQLLSREKMYFYACASKSVVESWITTEMRVK